MLPLGGDLRLSAVHQRLGGLGEVIHREVHALRVLARCAQSPGPPCAAAEHHRIVARDDLRVRLGVQEKGHALRLHQSDSARYDLLGQLHVRDAVLKQSARTVRALDDGDAVATPIQIVRRRQPRGAGAHHRHALSRAHGGDAGLNQSPSEALFNQVELVVAGGDGAVVGKHARLFAQRRAHAAREFGEAGRLGQAADGLLDLPAIEQIVPLRDQVVQRTAVVRLAVGHAAVHAAGRLLAALFVRAQGVQEFKVLHALSLRSEGIFKALVFQKTCRLSHALTFLPAASCIRWG